MCKCLELHYCSSLFIESDSEWICDCETAQRFSLIIKSSLDWMCLCELVSVGFWVKYTAIQIFSGSLYVIVRLLLIRMEKNKYPDRTGCSKVLENKSWAKPISLFIIAFNHPHNSVLINLFTGEDVRPITQLDWHRLLITTDVKCGKGVTVVGCARTHTHFPLQSYQIVICLT